MFISSKEKADLHTQIETLKKMIMQAIEEMRARPVKQKRTMSPEAKAKQSAKMKQRHAEKRAAKLQEQAKV